MLCCETRSCHAHRHNYLEGDSNSSSIYLQFLYSVLGTSLLWLSTVAFTLFTSGGLGLVLGLVILVLVLRVWSCLYHC